MGNQQQVAFRHFVKDPRHDLRLRMRAIAQVRVRYGYRRANVLLKRDPDPFLSGALRLVLFTERR